MLDSIGQLFEMFRAWVESNVTVQVDPLASVIAVLALIIAIRANRRASKMLADDRNRAGNISKVVIHEHSMQAVFDDRPPKTAARDAGDSEGFVCSVYSEETYVEVEGAYLKIIFVSGVLGQRRWEIRIDLHQGEGLSSPPPPLPHRLEPNSRLDWNFPTFITTFPAHAGPERRVDVARVMRSDEQLCFEFGAYSRASSAPVVAFQWHREGFGGFPLKGGFWTRVVRYSSLWEALIADDCPKPLRAWFLEWLECRTDFDARLSGDISGQYRRLFHETLLLDCWPAGYFPKGGGKISFGDPDLDAPRRRLSRLLLAIPDRSMIDRGHAVSGPGGSSELSQARMGLALQLLDGTLASTDLLAGASDLPKGLSADDPVLVSAIEARRLSDTKARNQLTRQESRRFEKCMSALRLEIARCTYAPEDVCERLLDQSLNGTPESTQTAAST